MTDLWGIGSVADESGRTPLEVSHRDMAADVEQATAVLDGFGLRRGESILVVSSGAESAQVWPYLVAARRAGLVFSCAEPTANDARRVEMLLRRLPIVAVLGLAVATFEGLADGGHDLAAVAGRARVVGCRFDAMATAGAAGLPALPFSIAGPTIAVGCAPGSAGHVDPDEWELGPGPVLRARAPRAWTGRFAVPVAPCADCGRPGIAWR